MWLVLMPSCNSEREPKYESFLIEVESIYLPEEITVNEPFVIRFSGTIGNNGCYRFSHFETEKEGNDIIVEAWGEYNKSADVCADVMVNLQNENLNYQINESGNFTISVKQPEGRFLEKQFTVQ